MDKRASYQIELPDYFERLEWDIIDRGFFEGAVIKHGELEYPVVFYDPSRLMQHVNEDTDGPDGVFVETNLVVVSRVDRLHIENAIAVLSRNAFADLKARPNKI